MQLLVVMRRDELQLLGQMVEPQPMYASVLAACAGGCDRVGPMRGTLWCRVLFLLCVCCSTSLLLVHLV